MTQTQRERFIPFNKGNEQIYIDKVANKCLTSAEYETLITANYEKDKQAGYRDRKVGYYDKWYRYNRLDEGKAYDEGVKLAILEADCIDEMIIIPA